MKFTFFFVLFPLRFFLLQALSWLQEALDTPGSDKQKIMDRVKVIEGLRKRTKTMDDCTSSRMRIVLEQQRLELNKLEQLADRLVLL